MSRTTYRPDRAGMAALALSPGMSGAMVEAAEAGRRVAETMAPRDSGAYASAFVVLPVTVKAGRANEPRAGAMLANTSPHAAGVEWHNGAHVLARAAVVIDGRRHKGDQMQGPQTPLEARSRASRRSRSRPSSGRR